MKKPINVFFKNNSITKSHKADLFNTFEAACFLGYPTISMYNMS